MAEKPAKEAPAAPATATAAKSGGMGGLLPIIAVVVLVPALSFAMAEFIFFPKIEKMLAASGALAADGHGARPKETEVKVVSTKLEPTFSYEFKDIVSNLAGSMKSRYIKVSFTAYSAAPDFSQKVETNKAKLLDATLSVLASLALADLEDPAVKNKVRNELIFAYETVLRGHVVEEIYFSEFVVQ